MKIITKDFVIFQFNNLEIRTIVIDNNVWFVAKDVAKALDYIRKDGKIDTNSMTRKIPQEDKMKIADDFNSSSIMSRELTLINESGLYISILGSKKTEASQFKFWITREVLPSIRKTGSYSIQPTQKPQTQLSEYQETLEYIDIFEKFSEKTKGKSHIELLKLDSFLTKSGKKSILDILNINLQNYYFSVSELGDFSGQKGSEINQSLVRIGFQISENGVWKVLESGKEFCFETQNSFSQLKWKPSILNKI